MKAKKRAILFFSLIISCLLLHFYCWDKFRVETGYSSLLYPFFSDFLRRCYGAFSLSIGDLIYGLLACWIIWRMAKAVRSIFVQPDKITTSIARGILNLLNVMMMVYLLFNFCWGINYDRKGIAWQTGIEMKEYDSMDLKKINELLLEKVNQSKMSCSINTLTIVSDQDVFKKAIAAYQKSADTFSFLKFNHIAVKPSLWGWLGNYLGYTGYYNPFTGEAQVNTTIPPFTQPFIVCHEMAHQLGYAKESEANFVAYLVSKYSDDEALKYSTYLELFFYANRNLYEYDSTSAIHYRDKLNSLVKQDIKTIIAFNLAHKNNIEPLITWAYDLFLKSNQQPKGMLSYNQVTAFLINYYRKFGSI